MSRKLEDDDEARRLFIIAWLGEEGYDIERLQLDEIYARRAVLPEWLRKREYDPDADLPQPHGGCA